MSPRRRVGRVALAALALTLVCGAFLWQWRRSVAVLEELEAETTELARRVSVGRLAERRLPELRTERARIGEAQARVGELLPTCRYLEQELDEIRSRATAEGITVWKKGDEVVRQGIHVEQRFSLLLRGPDERIEAFLDGTAGWSRITDVEVVGRPPGAALVVVSRHCYVGGEPLGTPARPPSAGGAVWLPPFVGRVAGKRESLEKLRTEASRLSAILREVEDFEDAKARLQRRVDAVNALRKVSEKRHAERRKEAKTQPPDPKDAAAWALEGDWEVEAGDVWAAAAAYRAAAGTGRPFTARRGIVYRDRLFLQEAPRSKARPDLARASCGLIAVDPGSGRTVERYALPGVPKEYRLKGGGVEITYEPAHLNGLALPGPPQQPATIVLLGATFRPPVFYATDLKRLSAMHAASILAVNFGIGAREWFEYEPGARLQPKKKTANDTPQTLPDLEVALRAAAEREPVNPWNLYYLGQALVAQGRVDEASTVLARLFQGSYPGTPYFEYSFMSSGLLRAGQEAWALRAYDEALSRRKALPQPIRFSTSYERMVGASFLRQAALLSLHGVDLDRQYDWLVRARELAGPSFERADDFAAFAWARYWRARGDLARAAREETYARVLQAHPLNVVTAAARADHALALAVGTIVAFLAVLTIAAALARARTRAGRSLPALLASVSGAERRLLAAAFVAVLLGLWLDSLAVTRLARLHEVPFGLGDALGHVGVVRELEERLATDGDNGALRFVAATANHLAGNAERARALYRSLPDHPRARLGLEAVQRDDASPPSFPTADDVAEAFTRLTPARGLGLLWRPVLPTFRTLDSSYLPLRFGRPVPAGLYPAVVLGALLLAAAFLRVPAAEAAPVRPGRLLGLVPGAADLARKRPWRGYATALLVSTAAAAVVLKLLAHDAALPGPVTAGWGGVGFRMLPFPTPPGMANDAAAMAYHGIFWLFPHAAVIWSAVALAFISGLALHVHALRAGRRP